MITAINRLMTLSRQLLKEIGEILHLRSWLREEDIPWKR